MLSIVEREITQAPNQRKLRGRVPTPTGQSRQYHAPLATFLALLASSRATQQREGDETEAVDDSAQHAG